MMSKDQHPQPPMPTPSIGKAFLIYAVIPLLLLIFPGLVEQCLRIDYYAVLSSTFGTGFGLLPPTTQVDNDTLPPDQPPSVPAEKSYSNKVHHNIERELQYLHKMQEEEKKKKEQKQQLHQSQEPPKRASPSPQPTAKTTRDVQKTKFDNAIAVARETYESDPTDPFKALYLADLLRHRDLTYHDGGSVQGEAVETYQQAIQILLSRRAQMIAQGQSTTELPNAELAQVIQAQYGGDEFYISDYRSKSIDGLLCSVYSSLGKVYFMANMFEDSVEAATKALEYKANDLDAMNGRASSLFILGKYKESAEDYAHVLKYDTNQIFADAITGLSKVLVAKEVVVPGGWDTLTTVLEDHIPSTYEKWQSSSADASLQHRYADQLKRMHLAMFQYYDVKLKDVDLAWKHLTEGLQFKMSTIEPFNSQFERLRIDTTKQIFQPGIWTPGVGSNSVAPIFVIGFVRSGSTLLERILDSHPLIAGTGEDSIFNGRLEQIRDVIVHASAGGPETLKSAVQSQADFVETGMRERWSMTNKVPDESQMPQRFVDKMLTNYMNVGFIHMVFPNALILHVARNPMDTIFSAYKHDFPTGHLDYLSEFESLAQIYDGYRQIMDHWDAVLPGRVTHIRYEDIVNDTPGIAKAIIAAAGLPWDPEVLNFHLKKHAVNTLSTTQVRKGIYKDAIKAWMRYEKQLEPLVKLVGKNVIYPLKTTLPGYEPPN